MCKHKFHKICRYIGYTLVGLLITLCLAAGVGAIWLWGWTWKDSPTFHENWMPEECAAITEFDVYLRKQYSSDAVEAMVAHVRAFQEIPDGDSVSPGIKEWLAAAYLARMVAAPVSGMLHHFAESGDAASSETFRFDRVQGLTPAIVAAQTGQLKALEALVKHGADPNAIAFIADEYTGSMEVATPMSPLLNGRYTTGRNLPWETRRQTAEFLLAHGGNLNASQRINKLSCDMALMQRIPERLAPWEWALHHGMRMSPENLNLIVSIAEARPLLERVLREKAVEVNDSSSTRTVLQSLLCVLLRPYDEERWREEQPEKMMEAHLDMLLAAGANPNLIPKEAEPQRPGESEEEYKKRINNSDALTDSPLDIATKALERAELSAHRELCRRMIEKLKRAGAVTNTECRVKDDFPEAL